MKEDSLPSLLFCSHPHQDPCQAFYLLCQSSGPRKKSRRICSRRPVPLFSRSLVQQQSCVRHLPMLNLKIMPNSFHFQRVDMSVLTEHTVADITKEGLVARLIVFPCLHASLPIKCSFQLAKNGDLNKESPVCMEKREERSNSISPSQRIRFQFK